MPSGERRARESDTGEGVIAGEQACYGVPLMEPQAFDLGGSSAAGHGGYFRMAEHPSRISIPRISSCRKTLAVECKPQGARACKP